MSWNSFLRLAALLLLLCVVGISLWIWKRPKDSPSAPPPPIVKTTPAPEVEKTTPPEEKEPSAGEFRDRRLSAIFNMDEYRPTLKDLEGFLTAHQRSEDALVAAFGVCRDPALLDELLASHPSAKSFAAVMLWSEDDEKLAKACDGLKKLDPKNPLPYLVQLSKGGELGDDELTTLRKLVTESPAFDLKALRPTALRSEAWQSVVKEPVKAWAYSLQSTAFDLETIETVADGIMNFQTTSQADGSEADLSAALGLVNALRQDDADVSSMSESKENELEMEILGSVPGETHYPGTTQTIQDRLAELDAKMENEGVLDQRAQAFLQSASPEEVENFSRLWTEKGMNEALKSLPPEQRH